MLHNNTVIFVLYAFFLCTGFLLSGRSANPNRLLPVDPWDTLPCLPGVIMDKLPASAHTWPFSMQAMSDKLPPSFLNKSHQQLSCKKTAHLP